MNQFNGLKPTDLLGFALILCEIGALSIYRLTHVDVSETRALVDNLIPVALCVLGGVLVLFGTRGNDD